ncbi:MAG: Hsp70 family protein [Polyangiaceae bacterium]|nr:Hsp70 family protein [Polyangiaceae bacterium]
MTVYGVDLGTTYTKCAVVREGNQLAEIVPLDELEGRPTNLLRSAVTVTTHGGRRVAHVGVRSSTVFSAWDPSDTAAAECRRFEESKLWIGEDPATTPGDAPPWRFDPHDWGYRPEDIGALVLRRVRGAVAERRFPPMDRIVVTHPQNFSEARREATRQAVRLAGLEVLDTITEPDAAALTFGIGNSPGLYMVFDIGGGTLDIVLLRVKAESAGGGTEIVTSDGKHVGGRRWDDAVYTYLVEQYRGELPDFDPDYLDARTRQLWLAKAEQVKWRLCSGEREAWVALRAKTTDDFQAPGETELRLSRAQFDELTEPLVDDCMSTTEDVLRNAGLEWGVLEGVIMVGGSARIPALQARLAERARSVTVDPDPDTVVVRGAALHARALAAREQGESLGGTRLLSVVNHHGALARGLGILAWDAKSKAKIVVNMVPKDSRLPYERTRRFTTSRAGQATLELELWEGEDEDPELCVPVGTCVLSGLEPGPAGTPIQVKIELRGNGEKVIKLVTPAGEREAPIVFDQRRVLTAGALAARRAFIESVEVR